MCELKISEEITSVLKTLWIDQLEVFICGEKESFR